MGGQIIPCRVRGELSEEDLGTGQSRFRKRGGEGETEKEEGGQVGEDEAGG